MRRTAFVILVLIFPLMMGCSSSETASLSPAPESSSQTAPASGDELVLMWSVPKESLDGYVLNYGYSPEKLEFTTRVMRTELERLEHAQFGAVYRYSLKGLSSGRSVFVTISAISGEVISPPSQVMEVQPR